MTVSRADAAATFSARAGPCALSPTTPPAAPSVAVGSEAALAIAALVQSPSRLRRSRATAVAMRTNPTTACWVAQGLLPRMAAADDQDPAGDDQEQARNQ